MENPAATIYCSNIRCQAPNPHTNKFCQQCRTPLTRRYLWAIGQGIEAFKPGEAIANRYALVHSRVLLDTQPGTPPETPLDIPPSLVPYLRLAPYGLHIPHLYGCLIPIDQRPRSEIWLLEDAPLSSGATGGDNRLGKESRQVEGQLLPAITDVWKNAPAIRQLNWLWQIAMLWQPLSSEGVASSLLSPVLLRVEGPILRLLELQPDTKSAPTLQKLGQVWSQWLSGASPTVSVFLELVCKRLSEGQIRTSEELLVLLDGGINDCGRSHNRAYQIFTSTDSGPSRHHNEDACYPPSGQLIKPSNDAGALAIVCDGIGGHEGGEVASHLAINTLREQVEKLPNDLDNWNPTTLTLELERAACAANDVISQQNDREGRSERQRMGTTLVMARSVAHEMYITHVGDSRVYWITRHNCHQVTLDDDLASREVRLGYALYRNAIQQPTSGSLVQALGMAPSATLHPTVQRFILDEDCIFLLCSDGLSDYDRVEQFWQTEILPILEGQADLPRVGERLIEIANTHNGHDNATIALIYCKVSAATEGTQTPPSVSQTVAPTLVVGDPSGMKTQQLPSKVSTRSPWGLLLGIVFLLGIGSVLAYLLIPGVSESVDPLMKQIAAKPESLTEPSPANPTVATTSAEVPTPSPTGIAVIEPGKVIEIIGSTPTNSPEQNIPMRLLSGLPAQNPSVIGVVPSGSIVQVIKKVPSQQQNNWLEVRVCSVGTSNFPAQLPPPEKPTPELPQRQAGTSPVQTNPQVKRGVQGWIEEVEITPHINQNFIPTVEQQNSCVIPTPSPTVTPVPRATATPQ